MKKIFIGLFCVAAVLAFLCSVTYGAETESGPDTRLGKFLHKENRVITSRISEIATIKDSGKGNLRISTIRAVDKTGGEKLNGLSVSIESGGKKYETYVDYDELPTLIAGLDLMAGPENATAAQDMTIASYQTRDELNIIAIELPDNISKERAFESRQLLFITIGLFFEDVSDIENINEIDDFDMGIAIFYPEQIKDIKEGLVKAKSALDTAR